MGRSSRDQPARMPGSHTEAMPLIIQIRAKTLGRYALAIGSSIAVGIVIFYGTAIVLDFLSHLVVRNSDPEEFAPGSGLIVVFAWLFFGTIFGLTGLVLTLRRFWPKGSREYRLALFTALLIAVSGLVLIFLR